MSYRYSSVDRAKQIKYNKASNKLHLGANLVLGTNDFDINKICTNTRNTSLKTTNSKYSYPKKLPSINQKIINRQLIDIYSKNSDFSTTVGFPFSFEKENKDKINYTQIKTDFNKDNNYYNIVIHSNLSDRTSINNTLSSLTNFIKPKVMKDNKSPPLIKKYPNKRLYPTKYSNNNDNLFNSRRIIKQIKDDLNNKNNDESEMYKKIPVHQTKISYESKYEDVVFDANKVINLHKYKENELKVPDNDVNDFISKNKAISKNNVLIKLMNDTKIIMKEDNDNRNKNIKETDKIIKQNINNFENLSSKQRDLYFKISDLLSQIQDKNADLIKVLQNYRTNEKILEDEIFKKIEQIEELRIYAKFVHKVLGGDIRLFEEELIPDYENDNRPNINILVKKVYDKYGHLIRKHRLSVCSNYSQEKEKNKNINKNINKNNNELNISTSDNNDEIDFDLLNDPDLMIRKFKELEEKILRVVEKTKLYNKYEIKESKDNQQLLKDMKARIIQLQKEYNASKKALIDYKKNEFGQKAEISEEDLNCIADDLCKAINQCFNNGNKREKNNNKNVNNIDILVLNDEMEKCMDLMIQKENTITNLMEKIENYEKNENQIFREIMNKRKYEVKKINQEKNRENLKKNELKKQLESEERMNKIIFKKRKCEPPFYFQKKEVKEKVDENKIIEKENEELLTYK